jgi:hypothetical protein
MHGYLNNNNIINNKAESLPSSHTWAVDFFSGGGGGNWSTPFKMDNIFQKNNFKQFFPKNKINK